jgi:manganese/iron transport system ATP-binding protein
LISCHEWGISLERYDQLLLLNRHLIDFGTPRQVLTTENIQQAYGIGGEQNANQMDRGDRADQLSDELLFC